MSEIIVCDTGPLISLEKLENGFEFIQELYQTIIIPPAVLQELSEFYPSPNHYLTHFKITDLIKVEPVSIIESISHEKLHVGEIEAISLAYHQILPLLIEEKAGRIIAGEMGIQVSGIAKQILIAYQKSIIDKNIANVYLNQLLHTNRINQRVFDLVWEKIVS